MTSLTHLEVVVPFGRPAQCPECGMWVEPSRAYNSANTSGYRSVLCWCDNWLDIHYVQYVITELETALKNK